MHYVAWTGPSGVGGADIVSLLAAAGHGVNCKNFEGQTPLDYAWRRGKNKHVERRLVQLGAKKSNLDQEEEEEYKGEEEEEGDVFPGGRLTRLSDAVGQEERKEQLTIENRSLVGVASKFGPRAVGWMLEKYERDQQSGGGVKRSGVAIVERYDANTGEHVLRDVGASAPAAPADPIDPTDGEREDAADGAGQFTHSVPGTANTASAAALMMMESNESARDAKTTRVILSEEHVKWISFVGHDDRSATQAMIQKVAEETTAMEENAAASVLAPPQTPLPRVHHQGAAGAAAATTNPTPEQSKQSKQLQPQLRRTPSPARAKAAREREPDAWVQCDACAKWRRVPKSLSLLFHEGMRWTCAVTPYVKFADCETPQELEDDEIDRLIAVESGGGGGGGEDGDGDVRQTLGGEGGRGGGRGGGGSVVVYITELPSKKKKKSKKRKSMDTAPPPPQAPAAAAAAAAEERTATVTTVEAMDGKAAAEAATRTASERIMLEDDNTGVPSAA